MNTLKKKRSKNERKRVLDSYLAKKQLKSTKQRDTIFDVFFNHTDDHISVEELYEIVKKRNPKIGFATVYRTLKLFKECGLAFERNFGDGRTRYEPVTFDGERHDHIICIDCGKIICFNNPEVQVLLQSLAKSNKFELSNYKLELYGNCDSSCESQDHSS
ncbi:MAG: transcriptional repressor [Candidatus Dadabacteria bacterium]|nr:transcriptional repressor [Candidatus Dadabacteria bacterium]